MVGFYREALRALRSGISLADIRTMQIITRIIKAKFEIPEEEIKKIDYLYEDMLNEFKKLTGVKEVQTIG
jgi:hypothetical protein